MGSLGLRDRNRSTRLEKLAWIAFGGAFGAMARHGVTVGAGAMFGADLPWGTFIANVLGSLLLGALFEVTLLSDSLSLELKLALTTGFLGAFTTFSTFSHETVRLFERGEAFWAATNVVGNVCVSLIGVWTGICAVRWWLSAS